MAVFLLCTLLTAGIAAGLLSGCGNKKEEDGSGGDTKGRYVEQDIDLKLQDGEDILNLIRSKDGSPVLFTQLDGTQIFRYEYQDGEWKQTALDWISELYQGREIYFQEVQETADGTQLVRGMTEEMLTLIGRSADGQTGVELDIPWLLEQSDYGYPGVTCLQIDGAGNLWMNDLYQSKFVVIAQDSLEVLMEMNSAQGFSSEQEMLFAAENGNMAANTDDGVYTIYDPDFNEKGKLQLTAQDMFSMCSEGESWYQVSAEGITRYTPGNEISERLLDGSMGVMGSSSNIAAGITAGKEKDFYVLYRQEKAGSCSLKHYVYDEDASASAENTLKVFGLSENETVQDAIIGFQKVHPDTKVEYQTSGKEEGLSMDDIRTLNTELLSGNGADVLLLDGLPAEAYMEKGILADMTELKEELIKDHAYLEEMLDKTAEKDGKIYGMPVKFSIPIIYGNAEVIEALSSLESLNAYVSEHPEASVFGLADKSYIRDFLFQLYQEELFTEDGKIQQEKLAALLELEKTIAVRAKAYMFEEAEESEMSMGTAASILCQGMFTNPGSAAILNYDDAASTDRIGSIVNMMIPYAVMREKNLSADTIQDFYCPQGIIGINQNSEQKELAEEFVKYLFSQEVQGTQLDDGFPVLVSELENKKNEINSDYAQSMGVMSSWNFEGEDVIEVEAGYPSAEEAEELIQMCKSLKNPAVQDCVLWNIYQTEADQCLKGNIDAETAAKNIAQKVDTYLAE